VVLFVLFFFFSSRRRHTRYIGDWSSDVCSSDLLGSHSRKHGEGERSKDWGIGGDEGRGKTDHRKQVECNRERVPAGGRHPGDLRSEERRVGKESRSRRGPEE